MISGSDVPRVDRAIDIIYQTPDAVILPYLEEALKKNPTADPKKLVSAIANAESKIFKDFQAAPWDEVHHGRASLSSMRNVRYLDSEQRVLALNGIADAVGGPIGNSRYNLRGNSAARGAHTGGSVPWKTWDGLKYRYVYNLPSIGRENSMHPMGTNAAKDPRGIVVPQVDNAADFISRARDSIKIQFNDTVTGRYSDLPRRIVVENMVQGAQRRRGDISTSSTLLYGNDAIPTDVQASKSFLALPENEGLRVNMLKAAFHPDSPQGQSFLSRPQNAALADMYISQMYNSGLGPQAYNQLMSAVKSNWKGAVAGVAGGADREAGVKLGNGDYTGAAMQVASNAAIGAAGEAVAKRVGGAVLKRLPAAAARFAGGTASTAGVLAPAMALWGAYDIADGVVEGATGRGITQRVVESGATNTGRVTTKPATQQQQATAQNISNRMRGRGSGSRPSTSLLMPTPVKSGYRAAYRDRES